MNASHWSGLARALAAGAFASVVVACTAPVGTADSPASEGTSEEAIGVKCSSGNAYVVCPSAGAFSNTPFEQGLADLRCNGKEVFEGAGPGQNAAYQTRCSGTAKATFACGTVCHALLRGDWSCSTRYVTGNIYDLVQCNEGVAELDATESGSSMCECHQAAPGGQVYVLWDPTCSSGSCVSHIKG